MHEGSIGSILVAGLLMGVAGCAPQDAPEPEQGATEEEAVLQAEGVFDPAGFDTIAWDTEQAAIDRGALVFRVSCSKCHGPSGRGDGGFVVEGDTLRPPSLVDPDWRFADDPTGLREQIFVGTAAGMPHWGLEGLKYRDIDAVARFVTLWLRREERQANR